MRSKTCRRTGSAVSRGKAGFLPGQVLTDHSAQAPSAKPLPLGSSLSLGPPDENPSPTQVNHIGAGGPRSDLKYLEHWGRPPITLFSKTPPSRLFKSGRERPFLGLGATVLSPASLGLWSWQRFLCKARAEPPGFPHLIHPWGDGLHPTKGLRKG